MLIDVCNGDADGLCAVLQWRLHTPAAATLVTGLKRDIALLERVQAVERGNLGATGKLSRALSRRSVQTRSSAWSQFAHRMLEEQHHAASVHRASATSDMLVPLP